MRQTRSRTKALSLPEDVPQLEVRMDINNDYSNHNQLQIVSV